MVAGDLLLGALRSEQDPIHLCAGAAGQPHHVDGAPQGSNGRVDEGAHEEGSTVHSEAEKVGQGGDQADAAAPT
eukprot:4253808-Alexandrium_andersonii.AAC.1